MGNAECLAFSPDGKLFATSKYKIAQLWDITTAEAHGPPLEFGKRIKAIVFSPDGRLSPSEEPYYL